jgi:hypothetical protein
VRATAALERSVKLHTTDAIDPARYAATMAQTALGWTKGEQEALAPALARLQEFISAMKWKAPSPILLVNILAPSIRKVIRIAF